VVETSMANDSVVNVVNDVSNIVTNFLFNTCRLRQPNVSKNYVSAAVLCSVLAKDTASGVCNSPLTTGSVAEFYIEPMLSCVGDIDVMGHVGAELAIPRGYPPPTRLSAEFNREVIVYELEDTKYPGYACTCCGLTY